MRTSAASSTASNSASLLLKWWYSEPRLTPAASSTASTEVASNPRSAKSRVASATNWSRVAWPRSWRRSTASF